MTKIVEKDGQKYLIIGKKAIPIDKMGENGKPIINVETEETVNDKGGKDVKVKIPTLKIQGKQKDL